MYSSSQAGEPVWRRDSGISFWLFVLRGVSLSGLPLCATHLLWGGKEGKEGKGAQPYCTSGLPERGQSTARCPLLHHPLLQGAASPRYRQAGHSEDVQSSEQTEGHHTHPTQRLQDLLIAADMTPSTTFTDTVKDTVIIIIMLWWEYIVWGFSPFCAPISLCSSNDFLNVTEQRTSGLSSVT